MLNVADLARISSWVLRDAFVNPPPPFVLQLYQTRKAVEWAQHAGPGAAIELATGCWMVAADLRLEFSRKGGAYDSALVASRDALLQRLRQRGARLEWKATRQPTVVCCAWGGRPCWDGSRVRHRGVWDRPGLRPPIN